MVHDDVDEDDYQKKMKHIQNKIVLKNYKTNSFIRIQTLLKKNTKLLLRDYYLIWIMLFIPIIQSFALCIGIGTDIKNLKIAVKNEETKLSKCHDFEVSECVLDETSNQTMSCVVMNYLLSRDYKFIEVNDREKGESMTRHYETLAFLYFSQNYTKDLSYYMSDNREEYDFGSPVYMNFAKDNILLKNQIEKDVRDSVLHVIEKILDGCSHNPKTLTLPIKFDVILGKEVKSLLNSAAVVFSSTTGFFLSSMFSVSFMLFEKRDGFLSRSMFAGVQITEVLIALFCIFNVIYFLQTISSLFIIFVLFSNPILVNSSIILFFFILLLLGWIGFLVGILIAGTFPSSFGSIFAVNAMLMSTLMLSGFWWPLNGQVLWIRPLAAILPTTLAGSILSNITLRGWMWDHPSVVHGTGIMVVHLVLLILVLYGLGKVKKDMWILNK